MDAHDLPPRPSAVSRRVARIAVVVLAVMLAVGLWQGYGFWIVGLVR